MTRSDPEGTRTRTALRSHVGGPGLEERRSEHIVAKLPFVSRTLSTHIGSSSRFTWQSQSQFSALLPMFVPYATIPPSPTCTSTIDAHHVTGKSFEPRGHFDRVNVCEGLPLTLSTPLIGCFITPRNPRLKWGELPPEARTYRTGPNNLSSLHLVCTKPCNADATNAGHTSNRNETRNNENQ